MTPKEKASELVDNMCKGIGTYKTGLVVSLAIKSSLVTVDEIIKSIDWASDFNNDKRKFWQSVKTEIEKL